MQVWIDQDLCTGDALCTELCPDVFAMVDGLSYVRDGGRTLTVPGGPGSLAVIPEHQFDAVLDAAEQCPGECIYIEA
jgi:ferredoxin